MGRVYALPQFVNAQDGLLTIAHTISDNHFSQLYLTHDGGLSWQLDSTLNSLYTVQLINGTHWVGVAFSGSGNVNVLQRTTSQIVVPVTMSELPTRIDKINFVSSTIGWASLWHQSCSPGTTGCTLYLEEYQLIYTSDGGRTWQPLPLPNMEEVF